MADAIALHNAADRGDLARLRAVLAIDHLDVDAPSIADWTALHIAALNGRLACLEALLAAGASVHSVNTTGSTALQSASRNGHAACVRALIAAGSDVNRADLFGWTPFSRAIYNGHCRVLKILLRAGADVNTDGAGHHELNADAWALVDEIRKLGGWPNYVRRRRATLGIWVIRRLPTVIEIDIAACIEPPGGF